VVFDFDETLAPDSYDSLLESIGVEAERFSEERVRPLVEDGWDEALAKYHCLIEESKGRDDGAITRASLAELGGRMELYEGVPEMFGRLREHARQTGPEVELEFYLLTSGIVEIARGTPIAGEFRATWGAELHFDGSGEVSFVKRLVTHPEKARYLLALSKGLDIWGANGPSDVYREVPQDELHVPMAQMVYVGDGSSDMPAFSLLNERHGVAIGVSHSKTADGWSARPRVHDGRRVQNLAQADYGEGSQLMRSLLLAVESICKRIELRRLGTGD
jgi:phosphoserine phosphatase